MPKHRLYRSAYAAGAVTAADVLAFHRTTFGDVRMDGGAGGEGGTGEKEAKFKDPDTGEEFAFPGETPLAEMTPEQRTEYWRHKAQKHEKAAKSRADYEAIKAERDQLKAAGQTDAEKAAAKAAEEAATKARAEAEATLRGKYAGQLVAAKFEVALAGKRDLKDIQALVEGLDLTKFLTDSGEVDTDKVTNYAAGLTPNGSTWPDTGAGKRGKDTPKRGVSAGAEMFAASRGKTTT